MSMFGVKSKSIDNCNANLLSQFTFFYYLFCRHCFCCFKDHANFIRFNNLVQSVIVSSFNLIKSLLYTIHNIQADSPSEVFGFDDWSSEDKEKLLMITAKVCTWIFRKITNYNFTSQLNQTYQLSFPLYVAYKHSSITKHDELSVSEKKILNNYCDLSEYDVPIFLQRKIVYFLESDGFGLYVKCIKDVTPSDVSIVFVHSLISVIQNIKNYLSLHSINQRLVLIRTYVINYLCKMQDTDLRIVNNRTMFEYIWSVVKEYNNFTTFGIDQDGLRIALKYFNSSTLTMRLSGLAQINNYIGIFNDLQHTASSELSSKERKSDTFFLQ